MIALTPLNIKGQWHKRCSMASSSSSSPQDQYSSEHFDVGIIVLEFQIPWCLSILNWAGRGIH